MHCRHISLMLRCPLLIPIRYCSNLAPVSLQPGATDQILCFSDRIYDSLLDACLNQCKKVQSRRVFDEMPQRLSEASKASKIIHGHILKFGFGSDGQLGKAILDLYAKCGDLGLTHKLFHKLDEKDVLAWNSLMSMYSRIGLLEEIAKCFRLMRVAGIMPNQFSYAIALSACARLMFIRFGKLVHSDIIKMGFECNSFCESSLVDMYVKCYYVNDARLMFDQSVNPTIVSSTAMVSAYVQACLPQEALKIFKIMQNAGHYPDQVAYISLISAFVSLGRFGEAFHLFSQIPDPNAVAWNLMISGHAKRGYAAEAIKFFLTMRKSGVKSTRSTLGSVLSAIANLGAVVTGMTVHGQAMKQGLDLNVYVGSSLVNMYAKCQELKCASKVFESLDEKNVVLWNAMLGGYAQNGAADEVVGLFINMKSLGLRADEFTYTSILSACGCLKELDMGRQLHSIIMKENLESNLYVANALVDMYAKSGVLTEARQLFELMRSRDNVSWNAMIVGYVQEEKENEAFEIFQRMMSDGTAPDEVALASILSACSNMKDLDQGKQLHCLMVKYGLETSLYAGSSLIDLYVKCGVIAVASEIFYSMPRFNVVSMNTLIYGFAEDNMEEAVNLFRTMRTQGLKPTEITFANLLDSCDGPLHGDLGRQIHCLLHKGGLSYYDELLNVSLLSMYMNSLQKTDAINLFSEIPYPKSTVLWTSMISGLNQNGSNNEALEFFRKMRDSDVMLDQATFASTLKACSTLASLIDGMEIHSLIFHTGFNSDELVNSALIDMYAKCGDVKSSMQVFKEIGSKWDVVSWNSIIVGFAKNGYAEDALRVFDEMMQSQVTPDDVTFLGVLTACSHAGKVSEGRHIFDDIMTKRYGFRPRWDHYACMIDLFGRCGLLDEAEHFISNLVYKPDAMIWASFLGACQLHGDEVRAQRAAEKLIELEPRNSSAYILLSNIYASSGSWEKVNSLRKQMNEKGVSKMPGSSWVGGMD